MDILIESTRDFEKDISKLSSHEKANTVKKINDCASEFSAQNAHVYRELHRLPTSSGLNGYESSLYTLEVSEDLRVILSVDEDPIFGQVIFTLFRVVSPDNVDKAYQDVAAALYQEILHHSQEIAPIS
ncbi:hypothetical protein LEP3755_39330 [Leptolyngbya sp. NIES-3755]|nr:hypothetical protein LEP3755_39330 [Leptolyngbya sp. NIES-3755]